MAQTNKKRSIFWIDQGVFGKVDEGSIDRLDKRVKALSAEFIDLSKRKQKNATALKQVQIEPKDTDIENVLSSFRLQKRDLHEKLDTLKSAMNECGKGNSKNDPENVSRRGKFYRKLWKQRKDIVEDIVAEIIDGSRSKKKKEQIYEDIGIESDISLGVSIKDIRF